MARIPAALLPMLLAVSGAGAAAEDVRVIKVDEPLVSSTLLGFNAEPTTQECQKALSGMNATTLRMGGDMGHWSAPQGGQLDAVRNGYKQWDKQDVIANWAAANGMKPIFQLAYTPAWSNVKTREKYKYPNDPQRPWLMDFCPPDDPAVWKEMSKAIMSRYKGKVFHYEVWNEPNTGFYFQGEIFGATAGTKNANLAAAGREELTQRYVDLCKATFEAAREVDPGIKVYTACPHNDFFGDWLNAVFAKGLAQYSDGICLHIYVGPLCMAAFDNWWPKYLEVVSAVEAAQKKRYPLVLTEYGTDRHDSGALSLTQLTAMLGSFRVELLTQFLFFDPKTQAQGADMFAVFVGSYADSANTRTLRQVYSLFKDARYGPLNGASMTPGGEYYTEGGVPPKPDNKFHAFDVTKADGTRAAYVAAWRGRFCYGKGKLIDIPDMAVTIKLPGAYSSADEIDTASGELRPFKEYQSAGNETSFSLTLKGIKDGKEGAPRAFIFRRAPAAK